MRYAAPAALLIAACFALPAHAQTQSSVTVGTTTYDISVPNTTTLDDVQRQLSDILYYLRTSDSQTYTPPARTERSSFITDLVFSEEGDAPVLDSAQRATGSTNNTADETCPVFTTDLSLGVSHPQVRALQELLNASPQTRLAAEGAGSPGSETEYFGSRTFDAVYAFQAEHVEAVLAPAGLSTPTGYWGASSRAFANELSGCDS